MTTTKGIKVEESAAPAYDAPAYDAPSYTPTAASESSYTPTPATSVRASSFRAEPESPARPTPPPSEKTSFGGHFHAVSSKAGWPLNKAANMIGAEGWWPTDGEKECAKAARILHSFTSEPSLPPTTDTANTPDLAGPAPPSSSDAPMHPTGLTKKALVKIPDAVLRNCRGLAIFNVLRAGAFHASLAGGSGLVVARHPETGEWSPPSTFVVSTLGGGFVVGLDVYDCVCVLNTVEQVNAFTRPRISLGGEASVALGPLGTGGNVDAALAASAAAKPAFSYMKSRGLFAGVQIDGTVMLTRGDANAALYGEKGITAKRILESRDVQWPAKAESLREVLRAVSGGAERATGTVVQEVGKGPEVEVEKQEVGVVQVGSSRQSVQTREGEEGVLDEKERLRQSGY